MDPHPSPLVKWKAAIAVTLVVLWIAGCSSVVSVPIRSSTEARLLRTKMTEAEFGGARTAGGDGLQFRLYEGQLDSAPLRVPMLSHHGGLPALNVRFNDKHTVKMLADTGAQLCILDAESVLAGGGRVFVPSRMNFTVTGIGGIETAWIARFAHADIGRLRLNSFTTLVRRHKSVSRVAGIGMKNVVINLLGCPVFLGFAYVTFDYPRKEFVFSAGTMFQPSPGARAVPIHIHDHLITVPLRIGKHTIAAIVDTGANDQVFLSSKTISNFGLQERAAAGAPYRAVGLGGETNGKQFDVPLAFIGDVPLRNVTVDTGESVAWQARIGTNLLHHWRVTFDFRRNIMWLEP